MRTLLGWSVPLLVLFVSGCSCGPRVDRTDSGSLGGGMGGGSGGGSGGGGGEVDAGMDAGFDAGTPDAGVDAGVDAGFDAGFDAGPPDAGTPDAGVDAGTRSWDGGTRVVVVDLRGDVNRDGVTSTTDPADDLDEDTWSATHGAVMLANMDDDASRCSTSGIADVNLPKCHDATDTVVNGAADLEDLARLKTVPFPDAPDDAKGVLSVSPALVGGAAPVRFFLNTGTGFVHFAHGTATLSATDLRLGVELGVEATDIARDAGSNANGFVDVTLRVTAAADPGNGVPTAIDTTDVVRLRTSPVMTFHHLTPTQSLYVSNVPQSTSSSLFRGALTSALADAGNPAQGVAVSSNDQWTQDFMEFGYASMPAPDGGQHVMRVVLRSANYDFPTDPNNPLRTAGRIAYALRGPDVAAITQFRVPPTVAEFQMDTLNSFGNTETIPPYTLNGVSYPLGRVLRGSVPTWFPDPSFTAMLEAQSVQPMLTIDTSWLRVGHVDETLSFLPAATPRGWILLVNDARLARQMLLDQADAGNGGVQMFVGKFGGGGTSAARTIDQVLANTNVMAESAAAAAEVDAQLATIQAATGLTDAEIVRIPYLHTPVQGKSLAYQPGTVNGVLLNDHLFIAPDPFGPQINGKDIMKDQFEQAVAPYGYRVYWVDDWDLYHRNSGEVHCGTNSTRAIPQTKWWETGR